MKKGTSNSGIESLKWLVVIKFSFAFTMKRLKHPLSLESTYMYDDRTDENIN